MSTTPPGPPNRSLPLLLALFVGSGCAALIYEIVWFQLLQLVIGSSAVSLGVLLGTFMGGMCLGSLALARVVSRNRHPLRVYALLELGVGAFGIGVLIGLPSLSRVYVAGATDGVVGLLLRGTVCAVCLLPPTVLMGATLPAVARWVENTPRGVSWLGWFYGGNIAGAVLGCLLAGFYLLRVHDLVIATGVAVAINGIVAVLAFGLAALSPHLGPTREIDDARDSSHGGAWPVYVTIALSGFCALGAEVIWTRLLSLILGPTVYTFSIILAVFLVGLGIGSGAGAMLARLGGQARMLLGGCQALQLAAISWTAYQLARSLPFWPINPSLSHSPWLSFQLDLDRCLWALLPGTILWGASFPLALAAVARGERDAGRSVGRVYAANTIGAIFGALGASLCLIPWVGTQQAQRVLIGLSAAGAILALAVSRGISSKSFSEESVPAKMHRGWIRLATFLAVIALALLAAWNVPRVPAELIAHGRYLPWRQGSGLILYAEEGLNASVAVSESNNGVRNFHVSGKVEASSEPWDMRLQRMLGHLPALAHPNPRSVLIVGCGAGVTAGSFVVHPSIERIVICEIEPLIPRVVARYFEQENHGLLTNRHVRVVFDDARHYLLTSGDTFDIITSDPIHPWVKGSAVLYTKEYFELVRRHLNPGGMVTQWVPLYESDAAVVRSELATFFEVFPGGTIWSNDLDGEGYDAVVMGQAGNSTIDVATAQKRLRDDARLAQSLDEVGFRSMISLLATYAGREPDLKAWLQGAEINRDRNLRLQYIAGLGRDHDQSAIIHDDLMRQLRFPEGLFKGSAQEDQMLRLLIRHPKPAP